MSQTKCLSLKQQKLLSFFPDQWVVKQLKTVEQLKVYHTLYSQPQSPHFKIYTPVI